MFTLIALCAAATFLSTANAAKSSGCGKAVASSLKAGGVGQSNRVNFTTSEGIQRTFLLHLPSNYNVNTATGLIFSFHGRSDSAVGQEQLSKLSDQTKNPNMFVVFPDGIDQQWQGDPSASSNDIGFTLDMIGSLGNEFCIDTDKIYATGMSNGGGFSANILACDPVASKQIAAFASISGADYGQGTTETDCKPATFTIPCNPGRKAIPILEFHGSADGVIPYVGGPRRGRCLPTIPHFMTSWADRNGLGITNKTTSLYDGHVKQYQFGSGNLAGINTHYWIDGMGHTWPSAKENYMNGTPAVVDFFNKWTLVSIPTTNVAAGGSPSSSTSSSSPPVKPSSNTSTAKPSSTTSSSAPASSTNICPAQDGKTYVSSGVNFSISCSADTPNAVLGSVVYTSNFAGCIAECVQDTKCGHVAFNGGACYKKAGQPSKINKFSSSSVRVAVKV